MCKQADIRTPVNKQTKQNKTTNTHTHRRAHMPISSESQKENFRVCKIEAGRATLISKDFEVIEIPSKLLPNHNNNDNSIVQINFSTDEEESNNYIQVGNKLIESIYDDYGITEGIISKIKDEIGSEEFLSIEALGCTAAILNWKKSFKQIFGSVKIIKIESIGIEIFDGRIIENDEKLQNNSSNYSNDNIDEYVNYILKGSKGIQDDDFRCRINLPIGDLKVNLSARTSIGTFKTNSIYLKPKMVCKKTNDLSGIFLVTDLPTDHARLKQIREMGGYISRRICEDQPTTVVVTENFGSELFREGLEDNLPVVSVTWLDALVSENELPHFEDHLLK